MSLEFLDWEAPEDQIEEAPLPYVQWYNGQGKAFAKLSPVIATGGWELPADVWGAQLSDTHEVVEVPHGNGATVQAFMFPLLHISYINSRFSWYIRQNGQTTYMNDYQPGATSRLNVYCVIKELGNFPVMLTLKGMVSKAFSHARKQHLNTVIKAASMVGKARGYPGYMFWMPVMAGPSEMVGSEGNQSAITPPVPAWDVAGLNDKKTMAKILTDLYVGDDLRGLIKDELYAQSEAWKERFNQPVEPQQPAVEMVTVNPNEDDSWWEDEAPQPLTQEEMPF